MSSAKSEFSCAACDKKFTSEKSLHAHIKSHGLMLSEYYTKYFPRYNLLTKEPLPFKNKSDYFDRDFSHREQLIEWCEKEKPEIVADYILGLLSKRISNKDLKVAPGHLELILNEMPDVSVFQKHFGSYTYACAKLDRKPMFGSRLPEYWHNKTEDDIKIFIDTREQQPLQFRASELLKLDIGDYAVGGEYYDYTYVDRKSENDFKSTLSKNNFERFRSELQRAKDLDSYLFVVTEGSIESIEKNNRNAPHKSNMKYIYHNMRLLAHEFHGSCQFIFTGSREKSQEYIPKILTLGKNLWDVDLQYYIDKNIL